MTTLSRYGGAAFTVVAATFAAACGGTTEADTTAADTIETTTTAAASEVATAQPRLALTYDGGVLVVDEEELTVVDDFALDGFNRLSPAGDGRHVLISTEADSAPSTPAAGRRPTATTVTTTPAHQPSPT